MNRKKTEQEQEQLRIAVKTAGWLLDFFVELRTRITQSKKWTCYLNNQKIQYTYEINKFDAKL
jgi:hypothetical protein